MEERVFREVGDEECKINIGWTVEIGWILEYGSVVPTYEDHDEQTLLELGYQEFQYSWPRLQLGLETVFG